MNNPTVFSNDNKFVFIDNGDFDTHLWELATGKTPVFFKNENTISSVTFSPDSKWLITETYKQEYKVKIWELDSGKSYDISQDESLINNTIFSPDSKWFVTRNSKDECKIWEVIGLKNYDFSQREKGIEHITFSPDSKWLVTRNSDDEAKVWEIGSGKKPDFLANEKRIRYDTFSPDSKLLTITTNHKVITYDISTGKAIQTLWVNKKPTQINVIDNRFVVVGKAILKMDLQTQRGNFFSYGDGEPLDYTYEEIVEWMKVFGDEYLGLLSEEVKEKYGVK